MLQACVELLKPSGGKIHAFVSSLPNSGTKALKLRDGQSNISDKEKQLGLLPQDNTYLTLAAQAADFNVSDYQHAYVVSGPASSEAAGALSCYPAATMCVTHAVAYAACATWGAFVKMQGSSRELLMSQFQLSHCHLCLLCTVALQICIDLFLLAQHYVDVATFSTLTHTTGGSLYHYLPFNPVMDQDQLLNDLKWNVSRPQVSIACLNQTLNVGLHKQLSHRNARTSLTYMRLAVMLL